MPGTMAADVIGRVLGHYEITGPLGTGGMGEVYRAHDTQLGRDVAIKILPPATVADPAAKERLVREARTASQLNHPNICTVFEVGESGGLTFIAMELVDGESLRAKLRNGPLASGVVLRYGSQLADALAHAHRHGIVHRDLKSANVMIAPDDRVKVLDFGVARRLTSSAPDAPTGTALVLTRPGSIVGTPACMAPEQLRGEPADARSDLWALGVVLHEMLTGQLPFGGNSDVETAAAVLGAAPSRLPPDTPPQLRAAVERCLEKIPADRFESAEDLRRELEAQSAELARPSRRRVTRRWMVPAAIAVALAAAALALWQVRAGKARWARTQALPQIEELANNNRFFAAYLLAREAERYIPGDPALGKLWERTSRIVDVTTEPEGADVYISSYGGQENVYLGRSPLGHVRVPGLLPRWKIEKPGYDAIEALFAQTGRSIHATMTPAGSTPAGMVRVIGGGFTFDMPHLGPQPPVTLPDFWIDKYEVTNREYERFVDAGGYTDARFWTHPFLDGSRTLPFAAAMQLFRDRTGRPGPATWEAGEYPEGRADYPVTGVSWYEAAAYAEFAGKSLPTVFHWARAAGVTSSFMVVPASNFAGKGLTRGGEYRGITDSGAYDMAGNAKEWCFNANAGRRFILGGGWNEPPYMFAGPDAQLPLARADNFGFRLAKYASPPDPALMRPLDYPRRDFSEEKPMSDAAFRVVRGLYNYDRTPLRASVDGIDDKDEYWRRETVSFDAAYPGERVLAYVFLPRRGTPPFQTVVYFPGSSGIEMRSSADVQPPLNGAVVKSGRAFVFPVYKSTYERGDALHTDYPAETVLYREHVFAWYRDLARTLDYVETRADLDGSRAAYFGFSWGARLGPLFLAVEPRLKTAILLNGGLKFARSYPEADPFNFAPRVSVPVLMVNSKDDFYFPLETSQLPLYRLLGTRQEDKRHVTFEGPHGLPPAAPVAKEVLDWLDRYLGPVK